MNFPSEFKSFPEAYQPFSKSKLRNFFILLSLLKIDRMTLINFPFYATLRSNPPQSPLSKAAMTERMSKFSIEATNAARACCNRLWAETVQDIDYRECNALISAHGICR